MSNVQTAIVVIGIVLVLGMIGEYLPRWAKALRDLEDARLGRDLYAPEVIALAVRGALIAHADLDDEAADRTAALVLDELDRNAAVFDGHQWRPIG